MTNDMQMGMTCVTSLLSRNLKASSGFSMVFFPFATASRDIPERSCSISLGLRIKIMSNQAIALLKAIQHYVCWPTQLSILTHANSLFLLLTLLPLLLSKDPGNNLQAWGSSALEHLEQMPAEETIFFSPQLPLP